MPAIRFVYFDLGNVLVAFDRQIACGNVAELFQSQALVADEILHESGLQNELESGRVTESEYCQAIRDAFRAVTSEPYAGDDVSDDEILRAISDMFTPIESMCATLSSVRQGGFGVGILSNTCNAHWSWVKSQSYSVLEGPFDIEVVSHEAKSMKPDAEIYRVAAEAAHAYNGATPGEILFVDDREENVVAARTHGWNAEVCLGGKEAESVLRSYSVLDPSKS